MCYKIPNIIFKLTTKTPIAYTNNIDSTSFVYITYCYY